MKDLTVEEICRRINIQANLNDLQSKSIEKRNSAITTLVTITQLTKRRDALYALCGYYILEINTTAQFFNCAIENCMLRSSSGNVERKYLGRSAWNL